MDASTLHLSILRDLRRVNSHIAAVAYDVLSLADPLESHDDTAAEAQMPEPVGETTGDE